MTDFIGGLLVGVLLLLQILFTIGVSVFFIWIGWRFVASVFGVLF